MLLRGGVNSRLYPDESAGLRETVVAMGGEVHKMKRDPLQNPAFNSLNTLLGLVAAIGTVASFWWSDLPNGPVIAFGSIAIVWTVLGSVMNPSRTRLVVAVAALALATGVGLQTSDQQETSNDQVAQQPKPPVQAPVSEAHFANLRWQSKHSLAGLLASDRPVCAARRKIFIKVADAGSIASIATRTNHHGEWRAPHVGSSGEVRAHVPSTTQRAASGNSVNCSAIPDTFIARARSVGRPGVASDQVTLPTITYVAPSSEPVAPTTSTTGGSVPQAGDTSSQAQNGSGNVKTGGADWGEGETVEPLNHE